MVIFFFPAVYHHILIRYTSSYQPLDENEGLHAFSVFVNLLST